MSLATADYREQTSWNWTRILLIGLLLLIAGLYLGAITGGELTIREYVFPVLLFLFPVFALVLRPQAPGVDVFVALFASLSVLFFQIETEGGLFIPQAPDSLKPTIEFLSQALILLFPFTFVHFSLVFPAAGQWEKSWLRAALLFIYVPLALLLVLYAVTLLAGTGYRTLDFLYVSVFPVGFLTGLAIFIQSYLYSLTSTEKNRLRVMLVGCLAGGLPLILANVASFHKDLALLLLPVFPLSLAVAVLKQDFAEPGPIVEKVLRVSMVGAGGVSAFFLSSLLLWFMFDLADPSLSVLSFIVSLAVIVPLVRWSGSYVGAHFRLPLPDRWKIATSRLANFEPIFPNPYIVGNPVRSPEMFFGRTEDFHFIKTKLEGQRQGCIILLCGERRAGKTSILYQILNGRLGSQLVPVFLDMQELVVQDDRGFTNALATRLMRGLPKDLTSALSAPDRVGSYLQLTSVFEQVIKAIGSSRLLLLFDEYELIGEKVREGRLSPEVGDYLNSLLERHTQLNMVFTGSRPLEADPAFGRLLGKSFYREISFLALPDAVNLICSPLEGRVSFDNQTLSELLLLTHGHPFFIQLLCQLLVEIINDSRRTVVTSELVGEAVTRMLDSPPPQLLYKWNGYSRQEKLVLAGLGTLLKRPGAYVPADRLVRLVLSLPEQHRKDLDLVTIRMILEDLRRNSILDRDQDRYGFTMDLLRRYIKAEHTVWSVLGEKG